MLKALPNKGDLLFLKDRAFCGTYKGRDQFLTPDQHMIVLADAHVNCFVQVLTSSGPYTLYLEDIMTKCRYV